ncbi:TPA: hypothetical protein HA241_02090 [Candidatus Woesearchaeota archaeon]|nr:hypothetical protein [Candidatus Woesearchaeota archaeon]
MSWVGKRGQAAAGAAVLLAIIAGLLIMFIILIPPQDRADLLGENISSSRTGSSLDRSVAEETLLEESPGRIDYFAQSEVEHPLPVVHISTITGSRVLAEKNVAHVQRGVFSEETDSFVFTIPDLRNTQNLLLSFKADVAEGRLVITLNGEKVFNTEIPAEGSEPVSLPRNLLQERNTLMFSVSSPGLAFWATNEISLSDLQIVADVTSVEAQTSRHIFLVSETEKNNLERVRLQFQPDCEYGEVGKLTVWVNSNVVYEALPDCDLAMVPIEFSPVEIHTGENEITFKTDRGPYLLSHVVVNSKLKEVDFPTYYFEVSEEQYTAVNDGRLRLRLTLDFVDVVTSKIGEVVFNGHVENFDTKEVTDTFDLSDDLVRGNNALKIKPRKTLEIREVRVELVK